MSPFKRQEPFRYVFRVPHDTSFFISGRKGKTFQSKPGKGVMLDLSAGGLRLRTSLDLPDETDLTFSFTIADTALEPSGCIVWKRKEFGEYVYGIDFHETTDGEAVVKALKMYAKA
ncbi:PilZ domain-containing protein [Alkalicoccus luteus]|uniref:PilZ domain-containing protein n=1 Tax=Alkalicoccus luteus TaxID=1237094 RepID=A0A969PPY9_9BACI|nr:PilZ domain-containing protein [Alkalicoccus luteus]NJP38246.1 PilZ domain-containing protein [Alkalicoccus luteus]